MRIIWPVVVVVVVVGCKSDRPISGPGRPTEASCPLERKPGNLENVYNFDECKADAECAAGKNGRCVATGGRMLTTKCTYDECFRDSDCKTGGPCECNGYGGNFCVTGSCRTDRDCGVGGSCARSSNMSCGVGDPTYHCRSRKDTCSTDEDCGQRSQCHFLPELGHFGCKVYPECPVG